MTLKKRILCVLAALTDNFIEEVCLSCKRVYWTQADYDRPCANQCPECETKSFTKWLKAMEQRFDKEIA